MLKIHILNWCDTFFYRTEGLGLWGWLFKALRVWMLLWSVRSAFRCFRDVTVAGWTSWNAGSSTLQALATWLMNSGLVSILSWGKISAHKNILGWTTTKNLFFFTQLFILAGNEKIYELTNTPTQYELRFDLGLGSERAYAVYDSFKIGTVKQKYKLAIGKYKGTAGEI